MTAPTNSLLALFALALATCSSAMAGTVILPDPLAYYPATQGDEFTGISTSRFLAATPLAGTGLATLEAGERLPDSVFLDIELLSTDGAAALANQQYFEFTVLPLGGATYTLQTLSFESARGGSSSPRGWLVLSSRDGFTAALGTGEVTTVQPDLRPYSIDLPQSQFARIDTETTFRVYGYAPGSPGVGLYFDNIQIMGVVPEPGIPLFLALTGGLIWRRQRRNAP